MTRRRLWWMMSPLALWLAVIAIAWILQYYWIGSAEERVKVGAGRAGAAGAERAGAAGADVGSHQVLCCLKQPALACSCHPILHPPTTPQALNAAERIFVYNARIRFFANELAVVSAGRSTSGAWPGVLQLRGWLQRKSGTKRVAACAS